MTCVYTNDNLYEEKSLVLQYFTKKAQKNKYPHSYTLSMYNAINEVYDYYLLKPNYEKLNHYLVQKSIGIATKAHEHQRRKYFNLPYIVHPMEMASYLSQFEHITPEQLAATILHDVVEDTDTSPLYIQEHFGNDVANQVHFLTDPSREDNRDKRMHINFQHLVKSDPIVYDLKITDLLSNTRSILFCDSFFAALYIPVMEKITNYFNLYHIEHPDVINIDLLSLLNKTLTYSKKILYLQKQFNIVKLDR